MAIQILRDWFEQGVGPCPLLANHDLAHVYAAHGIHAKYGVFTLDNNEATLRACLMDRRPSHMESDEASGFIDMHFAATATDEAYRFILR